MSFIYLCEGHIERQCWCQSYNYIPCIRYVKTANSVVLDYAVEVTYCHAPIMVTMCHPRSPSWTPQTSSSTTGSSATSAWRALRCSCGDTSLIISSLTIYPQVISIFYYSSVTHVYQTIHSQFWSLLYLEGSVFMHIIMYDDSTVSTQSRGGI